jgi:hypothetical protein
MQEIRKTRKGRKGITSHIGSVPTCGVYMCVSLRERGREAHIQRGGAKQRGVWDLVPSLITPHGQRGGDSVLGSISHRTHASLLHTLTHQHERRHLPLKPLM